MSIDKEFEQLSAYLDDELTPTEREYIQQRIASSPELQRKLAELQQMKKLVTAVDPLPEDPYFSQRLAATIKERKSGGGRFLPFRKPVAAFAVVTILMMVFIKFSPIQWNSLFEEQKSNILDFYTQNLQPFFTASDLTSEDIFNFAFHKTLPVGDEANQVLSLTSGDIGKAFFEIRDKEDIDKDNEQNVDMERFITSLDLNQDQQRNLDSILRSYSDRISSTILVNNNSTLAVNPDLINIQAALRAEILLFAADANEKALEYMFKKNEQKLSLSENREVAEFVNNTKFNPSREYYCLTPDTSFTMELDIDIDSLHRDLQQLERDVITQKEKLVSLRTLPRKMNVKTNRSAFFDSVIANQMQVWVDNNSFKFEIPMPGRMPEVHYNCDSIRNEIDEAMTVFKSFEFNIRVDSNLSSQSFHFSYRDTAAGQSGMNMGIVIPDLGNTGINIDSIVQSETMGNIQFDMGTNDSTGGFYFKLGDSVIIALDSSELHIELEHFRKEMKTLRKEMELFRQKMMEDMQREQTDSNRQLRRRWEI